MTEFSNDAAGTEAPTNADSWEGLLANLRNRYPGQKDSVLFCLHKLHGNPELGLPDFRDEAALHGIPMAGRALHSAKVLMGLATAKPRSPNRPKTTGPQAMGPHAVLSSSAGGRDLDEDSATSVAQSSTRVRRERASMFEGEGSIESKVLDAVRQIQSAAGAEAERLRTALRQAVAILQRALDD